MGKRQSWIDLGGSLSGYFHLVLVFHGDDGDLLAGHAVHVLQCLEEPDLNCGLNVENVGGLPVQFSAFEVGVGGDDVAFDLPLGFRDDTKILAEPPAHAHVLEVDPLDIDAPDSAEVFHVLFYLLVDLLPLVEQVLQNLNSRQSTY